MTLNSITPEDVVRLAAGCIDDEQQNMAAVYIMCSLMHQWDVRRGKVWKP